MSLKPTFEPFDLTDADIASFTQIINSEVDVPYSIEDVRLQLFSYGADAVAHRNFIREGDQRVGVATCVQSTRSTAKTSYVISLMLFPAYRTLGWEDSIYRGLIQWAEQHGARTILAHLRSDRAERIDVLKSLGFERVMRTPVNELDLEHFDFTSQEAILKDVERSGVRLESLKEMVARGIDWVPPFRDLHFECVQDVPHVETPRQPALEEWRGWVDTGLIRFLEGWIIALDGDKWVGLTSLQPELGAPEVAMAGLTGVIRSHRRRGIAMALKIRALKAAREAGVRRVTTDNEENNVPILELNRRFGFREVYANETYRINL